MMDARPPAFPSVSIRRQAGGFCAEGPGFYVWDEDPREVSQTARALAMRPGAPDATRRSSVASDPEEPGAAQP